MQFTSFMFAFATAASISCAAVQGRQAPDLLAEIKGWKEVSDCSSSSAADIDFNIGNSTLNLCVALPYTVATLELGALRTGPYQGEFLPPTYMNLLVLRGNLLWTCKDLNS
jgi:hypothetical protein